MKRYTVGFIFTPNMEKVLLIHKTHPEWQKGKINGPGGKIEANETPHECIAREIREETNLTISPEQWTLVVDAGNEEWNVKFLGTIYPGNLNEIQSLTEEKVEWVDVQRLPSNVITNLHWLIPLCKDALSKKDVRHVKVDYFQRPQ